MDKASPKSVYYSVRGAALIKLAVLSAGLVLATATVSSAQSFDAEYGTGNVGHAGGWTGVSPLDARAAYYGEDRYGTDRAYMTRATIAPRPGRVVYRNSRKM